MAEVKWIKITTNMFEDEKIDFIESLPESDAILVIWLKLLALAGKCNINGFIFLTENIPYTKEMLAHKFRRPPNTVNLAIETLARLDMIQFNNDGFLKISNWEKHQNIEGLEKIRAQTRKRVAKYRDNQKLLDESNVTCNVTVTQGNETDIDKELELEEDKDKDIIMTPFESEYISLLEGIENYPLDRAKDLKYMKQLMERYPTLDLVEAAKKFSVYVLDNPFKKKSNHRSQLNTSFSKYAEWETCLKANKISTEKYKDDNPFLNRGE